VPEDVPAAFWDFVNQISEEIDLKGWRKYRGDFAPTTSSLKAYYTEWNGIESMSRYRCEELFYLREFFFFFFFSSFFIFFPFFIFY
jgi:hypothetical protein